MRLLGAALAAVTVALGAPGPASAASLAVDPKDRCYREGRTVGFVAHGYTANGFVDFTRDGQLVKQLQADPSGSISGNLRLPPLGQGQRRLTYVATDAANPALSADVTVLASATDVRVKPRGGAANRLLTIDARGFFGGRTLWAHVRRVRRDRGTNAASVHVRTVKIGRLEGACRRIEARKRLFRRGTAPGRYRVQFDAFRTYRPRRPVEYDDLFVNILSRASGR
jgi:hypothetical protein